MKNIILFFFLISAIIAQDTTKSEAFKRNLPKGKSSLHKPKYPSYPLLTGYLLQQEANNGDPFAQHELGIRLLIGKGFQPDTNKAVYWIQKAASQNIPSAAFNLGIMFYNGIGVEWDPFNSYKNFKYAAESGMPEGEYAYAIFFTENLVVNKDLSKAYKWFKAAAEKDYKPAKESLWFMKEQGYDLVGVDDVEETKPNEREEELNQSSSIFEQDWELDYIDFQSDTVDSRKEQEVLEQLFSENKDELKRKLGINELRETEMLDDTSSLGLIKFAADNGSPEALLITATAADRGIVVKRDLLDAAFRYLRAYRLGSQKAAARLYQLTQDRTIFELLKKEVDKGNADAMYTWAGLVALGFDYSLTDKQAYELLEKAADKNHINSIIEIGLNYYNGSLVKEDKPKAIEFWQRAADLGSREAKVRIAFANISDEKNSYKKEIEILRVAANQGSVLAQAALAYCYEKGIGVRKRKSMAAKLYKQAAYRGNETAYNSLKRMYDELRPEDEEFKIYETNR